MIVGVPNHQSLRETAIGWMNLAWDIAIGEAISFNDYGFLFDDIKRDHGTEKATVALQKHWNAKRLALNNAFSLLQQSLEIALKAKIAEISPFLLIAGDPRSWPKPKGLANQIDFSSFRTIDAVQLCGAVNTLSAAPLPSEFIDFYDRLRQSRNKIVHLDAPALPIELKSLLVDILTAQAHLFPEQRWTEFRLKYLRSTERHEDREGLFDGEDYTTDVMVREVSAMLVALDAPQLSHFLSFDERKKSFRCPACLHMQSAHSDDECQFVQANGRYALQCILCLSTYSASEYEHDMQEHAPLSFDDREEINQALKCSNHQDI